MKIKKKILWYGRTQKKGTTLQKYGGAGKGSGIHERKLLDQLRVRQIQNLQIIV